MPCIEHPHHYFFFQLSPFTLKHTQFFACTTYLSGNVRKESSLNGSCENQVFHDMVMLAVSDIANITQ